MVWRRRKAAQDASLASCVDRRIGNDLLEVLAANATRTRVGHQQATGIEQAKAERVDVPVGARRALGMRG